MSVNNLIYKLKYFWYPLCNIDWISKGRDDESKICFNGFSPHRSLYIVQFYFWSYELTVCELTLAAGCWVQVPVVVFVAPLNKVSIQTRSWTQRIRSDPVRPGSSRRTGRCVWFVAEVRRLGRSSSIKRSLKEALCCVSSDLVCLTFTVTAAPKLNKGSVDLKRRVLTQFMWRSLPVWFGCVQTFY